MLTSSDSDENVINKAFLFQYVVFECDIVAVTFSWNLKFK